MSHKIALTVLRVAALIALPVGQLSLQLWVLVLDLACTTQPTAELQSRRSTQDCRSLQKQVNYLAASVLFRMKLWY